MDKVLLFILLFCVLFLLIMVFAATVFGDKNAAAIADKAVNGLWITMFFIAFALEHFLDFCGRKRRTLLSNIKRLFHYMCDKSTIWWLRSQRYVMPSSALLRDEFVDLKVATYISKVPSYVQSENGDFAIFSLDIRISDGMMEQLDYIKLDTERVFKTACVTQLGKSPAIYVKSLRKYRIVVWLGMNKYGDFLVEEERRKDDKEQTPTRENPTMDDLENKLPVLGYDFEIWEKEGKAVPITVDIRKYPGMLISGPSGSGKSVFVTVFLSELVSKFGSDIESIYYLDFKSASESRYLLDSGYSHYFGGDDCAAGLEEFYKKFHDIKNSGKGNDPDQKLNILIFDEAAAFFLSEQTKGKEGKALAEKHLNMMTAVGLQGRSYKAGLWVIFQQPNSEVVKTALRESLHTKVTFLSGGFSPEMKRMIGLDDETASQIRDHGAYGPGAAVVLRQGKNAVISQVPYIADIEAYQDKVVDGLLQELN